MPTPSNRRRNTVRGKYATTNTPDESAEREESVASSGSSPAGSRALERKRERDQEDRRRRLTTIGIIVGVFVVLLVVLALTLLTPAEATLPEAAVTRYEGLAQSRTQEGYPILGDLGAPVKVSIYSAFDCDPCRTFHDEAISPLVARVRGGDVALIFVPLYGYGSVPNGQGAAISAVCAGEQGEFWKYQDALYDWPTRYGNQAFSNNRLNAGVGLLTLDDGRHGDCVRSGRGQSVLSTAASQSRALLNFQNAPQVAINGVVPVDSDDQPITAVPDILAAIDREIELLGGGIELTPEATAESTPAIEATAEATETAVIAEPEPTPEVTPEATLEATPEATVSS